MLGIFNDGVNIICYAWWNVVIYCIIIKKSNLFTTNNCLRIKSLKPESIWEQLLHSHTGRRAIQHVDRVWALGEKCRPCGGHWLRNILLARLFAVSTRSVSEVPCNINMNTLNNLPFCWYKCPILPIFFKIRNFLLAFHIQDKKPWT